MKLCLFMLFFCFLIHSLLSQLFLSLIFLNLCLRFAYWWDEIVKNRFQEQISFIYSFFFLLSHSLLTLSSFQFFICLLCNVKVFIINLLLLVKLLLKLWFHQVISHSFHFYIINFIHLSVLFFFLYSVSHSSKISLIFMIQLLLFQ